MQKTTTLFYPIRSQYSRNLPQPDLGRSQLHVFAARVYRSLNGPAFFKYKTSQNLSVITKNRLRPKLTIGLN